MPKWWTNAAYLTSGIAVGFTVGFYIASHRPDWPLSVVPRVLVIVVCLAVVMASFLPKAWLEQRQRIRELPNSKKTLPDD